jgi:hypothetical protein
MVTRTEQLGEVGGLARQLDEGCARRHLDGAKAELMGGDVDGATLRTMMDEVDTDASALESSATAADRNHAVKLRDLESRINEARRSLRDGEVDPEATPGQRRKNINDMVKELAKLRAGRSEGRVKAELLSGDTAVADALIARTNAEIAALEATGTSAARKRAGELRQLVARIEDQRNSARVFDDTGPVMTRDEQLRRIRVLDKFLRRRGLDATERCKVLGYLQRDLDARAKEATRLSTQHILDNPRQHAPYVDGAVWTNYKLRRNARNARHGLGQTEAEDGTMVWDREIDVDARTKQLIENPDMEIAGNLPLGRFKWISPSYWRQLIGTPFARGAARACGDDPGGLNITSRADVDQLTAQLRSNPDLARDGVTPNMREQARRAGDLNLTHHQRQAAADKLRVLVGDNYEAARRHIQAIETRRAKAERRLEKLAEYGDGITSNGYQNRRRERAIIRVVRDRQLAELPDPTARPDSETLWSPDRAEAGDYAGYSRADRAPKTRITEEVAWYDHDYTTPNGTSIYARSPIARGVSGLLSRTGLSRYANFGETLDTWFMQRFYGDDAPATP